MWFLYTNRSQQCCHIVVILLCSCSDPLHIHSHLLNKVYLQKCKYTYYTCTIIFGVQHVWYSLEVICPLEHQPVDLWRHTCLQWPTNIFSHVWWREVCMRFPRYSVFHQNLCRHVDFVLQLRIVNHLVVIINLAIGAYFIIIFIYRMVIFTQLLDYKIISSD